jgi:hypothetical protein
MKLIETYKDDCSGFVRAVADDLMLFVPGVSRNADDQMDFMGMLLKQPSLVPNSTMRHLGDGMSVEPEAVQLAEDGNFVVCGLTSKELQTNRPKQNVTNGHVAVLTGGWGKTGWPLGYWGHKGKGEAAGRNESLSLSYRATDRKLIHYYAFLISKE